MTALMEKLARQAPAAEEPAWYENPAVAAGAAGLAGGGLAYNLLRRVRSRAFRPAMISLRQQALSDGFHRVVDLTPRPDNRSSFRNVIMQALRPRVGPSGKLGLLGRMRLALLEGEGAIPVVNINGQVYRVTPEGLTQKPLDITGVVDGRNLGIGETRATAANLIRGGRDLEGSQATQEALTELGRAGKNEEMRLWLQHSPDAIPEGFVGMPEVPSELSGADRLKAWQKSLAERFGGDDFLVKQPVGLNSGGYFPRGEEDWGGLYEKYTGHLADPAKARAFNEARDKGVDSLATYLREHGIYEGHVLDHALQDPANMVAQRVIPNPAGEWRVHSIAGVVPPNLITKRMARGLSSPDRQGLKEFVEGHLAKLPEKYRDGLYGLDVLQYADDKGKPQYKIMEMNPTEMADLTPDGGRWHREDLRSSFLETQMNPTASHELTRAVTGRDSRTMAAGKAALIGGGLGAATLAGAALARKRNEEASGQ